MAVISCEGEAVAGEGGAMSLIKRMVVSYRLVSGYSAISMTDFP